MILITGVTGFIGKHLLNALLDNYGYNNILALTSKPFKKCQYLLHNNYSFKKDFFVKNGFNKIETIIHAGAFIPKSNNEANDIELCNSNIYSTTSLLTSELPNLKKVIFLSTIDIYSSVEIISEKSIINPVSLYGQSKLYCERLVSANANQKNFLFQIFRIGHVYGEGEEKYKKIIPVTISNLINGKELDLYNGGDDIRTFIHVKDIVRSIVNSINYTDNIGVVNLVGDEEIKIKDLIKTIIKFSDKKPIINNIITNKEARNIIFNNSKMKKYFGTPKIKLMEGLQEEWNYMKKYNNETFF